jgi:AcrR family transcriptional regulator
MIVSTGLHDSVGPEDRLGGSRVSSSERGERGLGAGSVAPLYERLPRGPHRLDHKQVIRNQRTRLHGAMVEAVAAEGYEGASIRQLVGLAGVSRRSFYELYANKQECFLATFDSIAASAIKRIRRAYRASEGDLEDRLRAAFEAFAEGVATGWKDARLVIVEAQTAGPAGLVRLRRTTAICERMLFSSFALAPDASPLPMPAIRGIVGGLHAAMSMCLRERGPQQLPALAEEMLRWTLLFKTRRAWSICTGEPEDAPLNGSANGHHAATAGSPGWADRERLLHHVLRLALVDDYKELSAPQIADEAGVPIDVFFELFADKDACYLAALDRLGDELLRLADHPDLLGDDWPRAVRRVIAELMRYLAGRPLYAQTIAAGAFAAGARAAQRNREIGYGLARLLIERAPERTPIPLAVEGVMGAIGHTIRCQAASGQTEALPAVSGHLTYVVLAPFIGADAAAAIVSEDQQQERPQRDRQPAPGG